MPYVSFNGKIVDRDEPVVSVHNRAYRYGDGLFESMRVKDGQVPFFSDHMERLGQGVALLKLQLPKEYTSNWIASEIRSLSEKNGYSHAYARLIVYRQGEGSYSPDGSLAGLSIDMMELEDSTITLNDKGLTVGLYDELLKQKDALANFKTLNSLIYVMASIKMNEEGWDDCFIINTEAAITDASSSNVFIVKDGILATPSLSSGCVDGVMRRQVIRAGAELGRQVAAMSLDVKNLAEADEVFFTNAVSGVRWVEKYGAYSYNNNVAKEMVDALNASN
jgi:branched-chain amino acid aminotransferase